LSKRLEALEVFHASCMDVGGGCDLQDRFTPAARPDIAAPPW
jgi:hypothetical protein